MINNSFDSKLSECLIHHSIISKPEDLNNKNQSDLIKQFQTTKGLTADGVPGPDTLWALQEEVILSKDKLKLVEVPVDKFDGIWGLEKGVFREDAATKFEALKNDVHEKGGKIGLSAGIRDIKIVAGRGQSPTSMHYPGLAFDLNIKAGFFNPDNDIYVMTKVPTPHKSDANRYRWNVFCKSELGEEMDLEAYYWENEKSGVDLTKKIIGKFIDFTALAGKHGFSPIRPHSCFRRETNRFYICCEWWHFQLNELLTPKFSQFGVEIMKIDGFTPEFLQQTNPRIWEARKSVYFKTWW
ncbi:MAG: hypothetical protein KDK36_05420 [Leptospiraceae bacterium]|nr:hypothetical protein [Leptospiraceae bacterium]